MAHCDNIALPAILCMRWLHPGALDGLLERGSDDLTSLGALIHMVTPLNRALRSYRDRAVARKWAPSSAVAIEAAVQGW